MKQGNACDHCGEPVESIRWGVYRECVRCAGLPYTDEEGTRYATKREFEARENGVPRQRPKGEGDE